MHHLSSETFPQVRDIWKHQRNVFLKAFRNLVEQFEQKADALKEKKYLWKERKRIWKTEFNSPVNKNSLPGFKGSIDKSIFTTFQIVAGIVVDQETGIAGTANDKIWQ